MARYLVLQYRTYIVRWSRVHTIPFAIPHLSITTVGLSAPHPSYTYNAAPLGTVAAAPGPCLATEPTQNRPAEGVRMEGVGGEGMRG
jgi:hypothetical protein